MCSREVGALQMRHVKGSAFQVRTTEVGANQMCSAKVGILKMEIGHALIVVASTLRCKSEGIGADEMKALALQATQAHTVEESFSLAMVCIGRVPGAEGSLKFGLALQGDGLAPGRQGILDALQS